MTLALIAVSIYAAILTLVSIWKWYFRLDDQRHIKHLLSINDSEMQEVKVARSTCNRLLLNVVRFPFCYERQEGDRFHMVPANDGAVYHTDTGAVMLTPKWWMIDRETFMSKSYEIPLGEILARRKITIRRGEKET